LPDIRASIEYHDKAIALSGLAHFLNLDKGGSYALAAIQERPFVQALNAAALGYAAIIQAHVIEDLIDINFGVEERCPRLVFSPIGSQQDATAASLKMLVEAGLLAPDLRIERALRQLLDLPAKPEEGDPDAEPPVDKPEPAALPAGPAQTSAPDPEEDTGA
jgi:HAMP domain-containing protein